MIAQHREVHTVLGSILSPRKGFQGHPVVKPYIGEHLACLLDYHEYSVKEMVRRGWSGHQTPVSRELLDLAELRQTENTCSDWFSHVYDVVPTHGTFSVDYDMHDLVERWTNENKFLRNDLAAQYVDNHMVDCNDPGCVSRAGHLLLEYGKRIDVQKLNPASIFKVTGHSSLRGNIEMIGV